MPRCCLPDRLGCGVGGPGSLPWVIPTHTTAPRTKPQVAFSILKDRCHGVVCQSVLGGVGGPGSPCLPRRACRRVIPTHTAVPRTKPQVTFSILTDRKYSIVSQPVLGGNLHPCLPIVSACTTAPGAEPEIAFTILVDRPHTPGSEFIGDIVCVPMPSPATSEYNLAGP